MDESAELGRLGEGGSEDRLGFRLVLRILFRCVPLLKPVAWHLVAVVGIGLLPTILAAYPAIQIVNVWWNRHFVELQTRGVARASVLRTSHLVVESSF